MCLEHDSPRGISRRGLGSLLAGVAGMSLLSLPARAANVDILCVTCIDFRFVTKDVTWLNTNLGLAFNNYDIVALAGASLAATEQPRVPQHPDAFWNQVKIAKSLHHIKKVVLVDHMDCGAYREAFGKPGHDLPPEDEEHLHEKILTRVAAMLRSDDYKLDASCYLMPVNGPPREIRA